jgi:CRISPR/Cas system-associated exonuclease Cas4 (RecB family)
MKYQLDKERVRVLMGDKKFSISFSLLRAMKLCPRQAFLSIAVDRKDSYENEADTIGPSTVHSVFENWLKQGSFTKGWMVEQVEAEFVRREKNAKFVEFRRKPPAKAVEWGIKSDRQFQIEKARRAVVGLEQFVYDYDLNTHQLQAERWVTVNVPDSNIRLRGCIDLWDDTMSSLYDIKVTEDTSYGDVMQLTFYALLMHYARNELPKKMGFIYPLAPRNKVFKRVDLKQEYMSEILVRIRDFVRAYEELEFPATPVNTNVCYRCAFKSFCPRFGGSFGVADDASPIRIRKASDVSVVREPDKDSSSET